MKVVMLTSRMVDGTARHHGEEVDVSRELAALLIRASHARAADEPSAEVETAALDSPAAKPTRKKRGRRRADRADK